MLSATTLTRFFACLSGSILLFVLPVVAQQMNFVNVSSKLGLPATECYNIFQDSKGYIWIGTEAGLCRYNGNTIEVFDKHNGLPERAVYAITEDDNGLLWLVTSRNRILFYKDRQLHEAPFSSRYQSLTMGTLTYAIGKRGPHELLVNTYHNAYSIDLEKQSLTRLKGTGATHQVFFEQRNNQLSPMNGYVPYPFYLAAANDRKLDLVIISDKSRDTIQTAVGIRHIYNSRLLACKVGEYLFCSGSDKLFRISRTTGLQVTSLKGSIISLYVGKDNGLWVGTYRNGVNYYSTANDRGKSVSLLKGLSVSGICEDKEGNIWLSTLEKGVFICKNKSLVSFANIPNLDQPVGMLKNVNGAILASAGINKLYVLNAAPVKALEVNFNRIDITTDVLDLGSNRQLVLKGTLVETDKHFKEQYRPQVPTGRIGEGRILLADSSEFYLIGFLWFMKYQFREMEKIFRLPAKGMDMCYYGKDSFLVGCRNGLYAFRRNDTVLQKVPGINGAVTRIWKASDQVIWIATKEEGLFQLRQNKLWSMKKVLDLKTDAIFNITEDPYHNIWLGSDAGLIRLAYPFDKRTTQYYSMTNGLPDNEVLKLAADSQYVYVSTHEGVSGVPLSETNKISQPPVYLNDYTVNGEKQRDKINGQTFAYDKNNLELNFDILSFDLTNGSGLLFRLNDNAYLPVKGNVLKLYNLKHGDYKLVVYGVSAGGIKSTHPVTLHFSIGIPFWKTWQFVLLAPLLLMGLIIYAFNRKVGKIKKAADEKNKLSKLISSYQLFALQAQMNPHFIFNSINSIQYFILQQKDEDAYQYLNKFSRLIRNVLNNSGKLDIPLNQEIDMLKTYIELEQCRFAYKFDYELNIGENIDAITVSIPPMLIQPYVENAIWHGLLNLRSERKGKLTLCFLMEGQLLKVIIRDNGIGREKAAIRREQTHKPVAMELTAKRLDMVHQIWGDDAIKVNITDLYDEDKKPAGTEVEVYLPLNMQLSNGE